MKALGNRIEGGNLGIMDDCVKAGFMGRKSGKGIFIYNNKTKGAREVNQVNIHIYLFCFFKIDIDRYWKDLFIIIIIDCRSFIRSYFLKLVFVN